MRHQRPFCSCCYCHHRQNRNRTINLPLSNKFHLGEDKKETTVAGTTWWCNPPLGSTSDQVSPPQLFFLLHIGGTQTQLIWNHKHTHMYSYCIYMNTRWEFFPNSSSEEWGLKMKTEYCERIVILHSGKYCIMVFIANLCLGFNMKLIQYTLN